MRTTFSGAEKSSRKFSGTHHACLITGIGETTLKALICALHAHFYVNSQQPGTMEVPPLWWIVEIPSTKGLRLPALPCASHRISNSTLLHYPRPGEDSSFQVMLRSLRWNTAGCSI